MTARDYVVTVRVHPRGHQPSNRDRIERVVVSAYEVTEAYYHAIVFLDARFALFDHGFELRLINVEPDCDAALRRTVELLEEIALRLAPAQGSIA